MENGDVKTCCNGSNLSANGNDKSSKMAGNKMTNASTITKRKRFKRAKDKKDEDAQIKPSYEMDQRDPVTRGLTSNSFDPRGVNSTSTRGLNNSNAKNFYTRGSDGARETVRRRPGKKSYRLVNQVSN